ALHVPAIACRFQRAAPSVAPMSEFPFGIVGFDLDGTLLDTHRDLGAAVNHALELAGRPPIPVGDVRGLVGGGAHRMVERALLATGGLVPEAEFARLHTALLGFYEDHIADETRLFPGGQAMLDALATRGVRLAVVTNKRESLAVKLFAALGLSARF